DIYQKSHEQARGLKTERVPIIFINKYFTQFIPGKQESYATTTESLPKRIWECFSQNVVGTHDIRLNQNPLICAI
ncbi:MAG: hypothetical protein O9290_17225, partial [Microcystis sp. LE19-41.2A]|uniref:hypothetical protein n=1 Tax=Microcystis sp. LE19-41.2A TaxID=3016427 RepID=UPI0022CA22E9